jgi:hypothetical protein
MKTFQEWYTPETAEHLWNHKNGDEIAEAAYEAGQSTLNVLSAELSQTRHELEKLRKMLYGNKVDRVIESFNFDKVHKAMVALNWTWRNEGVPTIKQLKETARKLLKDSSENEFGNIMTGGFKAEYHKDGEFSLEFILAETSSYEY